MRVELRSYVGLIAGLVVLGLLIALTITAPPEPVDLLLGLLFSVLIVFTMTFGIPLAEGQVSLQPMTVVATCLVVGPLAAGWAAFVGALVHGWVRYRWAEALEVSQHSSRLRLVGLTATNATMHTASILAGGVVFQQVGGISPLTSTGVSQLLAILLLSLVYMGVNFLIAGLFIAMRGRRPLQLYLRALPDVIAFEAAPLIFAPLVALIYTQLGLVQFLLFALVLVVASLITRDLARASRRLERRVQELSGLQAVGQALSASLDLDAILSAIYSEVSRLMPASNFYVALYDPETDEVSFPLAVEDGETVRWRPRRTGNGLTEYVLRTCEPLLVQQDVEAALVDLGLDQIGRAAASWLGVPLVAGSEPLGIIAVQSYDPSSGYDSSHEKVLTTIAAQAAVAIQNADLYARTDEALNRRVQELDLILKTTHEGILLLDPDWRVLAANRALADFLGIAQLELAGQSLDAPTSVDESLLAVLGCTPDALGQDCRALAREGQTSKKETLTLPGPPEIHLERTLTPVRDRDEYIVGWLLVFRDRTEELELERLREDLTHMLIHDLRSPLTVLRGSLDMIEATGADAPGLAELLQLARRGNERMLRMINELLDISRLESGQMPVYAKAVEAESLLADAKRHLSPLAGEAEIEVEISVEPGLPSLQVDPKLIGRVLTNLLDNAIKFTPNGGKVRLWARPGSAEGTALVAVSDTGPGIPPDEQGRLFQKFQQAESVTGRRVGKGLGLSFCKLAIEAHGGQIWIESEEGKGSTFVMRLPLAEETEAPDSVT